MKNISAVEKLKISKDLKLMMYIILAMFIFIIITFFVLIIRRKISEKNMRLKSKLKSEYFDAINNFLYENIGLPETIEKIMPINYPIYLMTIDDILNIVKGDFHNKIIELSKSLKVYDFLIDETNSKKWWIKVKALYHLGRLNYIDGLKNGLYDKLIADKSADVRTALVMALSYLDNEKAIEIISKLLFDQSSIVREKAKEALLKFNNKSYNFLVNLLKDTNDIEKIVIILKILALIRTYNFISELDKYINNEDLRIQIAAIEVAGALEYPITSDILKEKLKKNDDNLIKAILKNITNISDASAIDLIKDYISHRDWEIRYYTARGLYSLGEKGKKELEQIKNTTNDKYAIDMIHMVIDEMKFA
ncbi:MAG TPA: HEAT repeat domain-containing protein [bacterium]|nr:HEAT repeat domain-containing protein [bacterium]